MSLIESALKKLQDGKPRGESHAQLEITQTVVQPVGELRVEATSSASGRRIIVSREELRRSGLLPPDLFQRQQASQFRRIKRPLLAAALGRGADKAANGHLIMVASALPGEGKSFTAMNLALSMAMERDITVLLADADVAKPHVSRSFGVEDEPGLVDALQDSSLDIESLVIPTDVSGLSILPAGRHVETAAELLGGKRMQQVIARLAQADSRRIVLFDSPPLLLTNESRVLTEVVGQVLLVVRAGVTARMAVQEAIATVADNKIVSLVLNQTDTVGHETYYGHGYGEYGDAAPTES